MAQEWLEVLGKRTRTSKTKRLYIDAQPTQKFSLDATISPMHYKDAGGDFRDIHTELLPSTRSIVGFGNPAYEMLENEYEMFVLGTLNSGVPLVRYVSKNTDYWVQFAAHNLQWTNDLDQIDFIATPPATPTEVAANEAKWLNAYGAGLDLRYVTGMGRMRKWLDIAAPLPDPPQFIIDGGNPVIEFAEILEFHPDLEVYINGEEWNKKDDVSTATEIEFRSPDGGIQFVMPVARGYHEGEPTPEEEISVVGQLYLKKQGPNLYVTVRFPWSWLQTATYPVHLDVTVDKQVGANADDGQRYTGTGGFNAGVTSSYIGYHSSGSFLHMHMFNRWTGVSIEGTIGANSYIECYNADGGWGTPEMKVYVVKEADSNAPTSAAEFDADPLTVGVDWDGAWSGASFKQSPSLASPLQELVDTFSISNVALMVQIKNDGGTTSAGNQDFHLEAVGDHGDKLHIEYTAGGPSYYHGLKVQGEGELALCDVGNSPLRFHKGGTTYGIELVATGDPNASRIRIKTSIGIKAIRKYT